MKKSVLEAKLIAVLLAAIGVGALASALCR